MRRTIPAKGNGLRVARGKSCRRVGALSHGRHSDIKDPKPLRRLAGNKIMLGGRKSPHREKRLWSCMADIIHRNHVGLMLASLCLGPSDIFRFQHRINALYTAFPQTSPTLAKMEMVHFGSCDRCHVPGELHEMARETAPPSSLVSCQSRLLAGCQPHCWDLAFLHRQGT